MKKQGWILVIFLAFLLLFGILASWSEAGSDRPVMEKVGIWTGGSAVASFGMMYAFDTLYDIDGTDNHGLNYFKTGFLIPLVAASHNQYRDCNGIHHYDTLDIFFSLVGTGAGLYLYSRAYNGGHLIFLDAGFNRGGYVSAKVVLRFK